MKASTKSLVLNAMLAAICLVLGLTMLGYIPIGPIQITIMCIPVIVGTIVLGLKSGLFLGCVFAFTSVMQIFIYPSPLYTLLFTDFFSWLKILAVCIAPRVLVPVAVHFSCRLLTRLFKEKKSILSWAIASVIGSVTNTVFFLGLFWLLFSADAAQLSADMYKLYISMFTVATTINAGAEAVFACIVCPPVIYALNKAFFRKKIKEPEKEPIA